MKWSNLKNGKCPKCEGKLIDIFPSVESNHCATIKYIACEYCKFKISEEKLAKILVPKSKSTEFMSADERLSELNNYKREPLYQRGDIE